jgi:hypothetical protein
MGVEMKKAGSDPALDYLKVNKSKCFFLLGISIFPVAVCRTVGACFA